MSPVRRSPNAVRFALIAVVCLSGAQCTQSGSNKSTAQAAAAASTTPTSVGSSGTVTPVPGQGAAWSPGGYTNNVPFADVLLYKYINKRRTDNGLQPLIWHDGLTAVAKMHSEGMANDKKLGLVSPQGIDIYQRLVSSIPSISFTTADAFVMTTPGNSLQIYDRLVAGQVTRNAMDNPAYTHFGGWYLTSPERFGAIIFGQNVVP